MIATQKVRAQDGAGSTIHAQIVGDDTGGADHASCAPWGRRRPSLSTFRDEIAVGLGKRVKRKTREGSTNLARRARYSR